ncbi:MAG TPA: hypothetical protein VNI60_03150 [Pyrinomonadaceae bacterium]|nr:hypothetical protein [Pyrinomonadaceae bacterium]
MSKLVYSSDSFKILRTGITLDEFSEKKNRKVKRIQAEYELKEIALMKLFKLMDK